MEEAASDLNQRIAARVQPMSPPAWTPRRLEVLDDALIEGLADVLIDCVEGDASVSFMHPLARDRARAFWRRVAEGVAAGQRALLVAEDAQGLCGTVQLILDLPENQPHRADVAKMLVHRRARRHGVGAALLRAAEATARQCGKTLLVLDAVTGGDAARLYERLGWVRVGEIPGYALMPRGGLCSTTVYYRELGHEQGEVREQRSS
jgi:GNAT superfamily N-acetyltransferase